MAGDSVSAESYAEQQFNAVKADPEFVARVHRFGAEVSDLYVVASSTPVSELMSERSRVYAVHSDEGGHGFALVRVGEVDW
jgi:hypothetical protein